MRFNKYIHILLFSLLVLVSLNVTPSLAIPTQFGDTGLLSQPTADTLNSGNICVGFWSTYEKYQDDVYTLVPVAMTLGLGSFLETYGSYPNVLLNGEETWSPRGYATLGFKLRFWGERSSRFKMSIDAHARRNISDNATSEGLTDIVYRLVASYKNGPFGIHVNYGVLNADSPEDKSVIYEDQTLYGGGIEFYPTSRLRLIAEFSSMSERIISTEDFKEASVGFQYYITPHLTFNLGSTFGLTDLSSDWTVLTGLSACQGIGSYLTPVPQLVKVDTSKKQVKPVKALKIKALTPVAPKVTRKDLSVVSKLEVPVDANAQEVLVKPSEKLALIRPKISKSLPVSPVAEFVKAAPAVIQTQVVTEPIVAVVHRKFRLPEFTFDSNQAELSPEGKDAITEIIEEVKKENALFLIRAEGHTDSIGSETYNYNLSLKRAISAASHLVLNTGFDPEKIFVRGMGESAPISDNLTDEGRSQNRRVELLILVPK